MPSVAGNGFAPATGPGDLEEYFPNAIGNRWALDYTATGDEAPEVSGQLVVSVTGTKTVLGVNATILNQADSADGIGSRENYYHVSPGGLTYLGDNDTADTITPQIVPYAQLLFPVGTGTVSSLTASNLPLGTDPFGNPLTLDMTQQIVNMGFENINVTAGSFVGALKQTTTITGTIKDAQLGESLALSGVETRWWVPHVGIVKQTSEVTVDTVTTSSNAELKGYVVNGVPRGIGQVFTAVDGLSPASGDPSPPSGRPVVATDGSGFLVVARRASGAPGAYTTDWLATPVQLDGTAGASTPISAPMTVSSPLVAERAAIAFDGANYLIVYEKDNNFASSGEYPSLMAQRVTPAGAAIGSATEAAGAGSNSPALAFDGTNFLLVFSSSADYGGFGQLRGVLVSPLTGQTAGADFPITSAQGYQFDPAVAFDGTNFLVVWDQAEWGAQAAGVHAARVNPAGSVLDAGGFAVYSDAVNGRAHQPAVMFDGANHVVVWRHFQPDNLNNNIHGMRVSMAGQLLDGTAAGGGFAITTATDVIAALPVLAMLNGNVLAAWLGDGRSGSVNGIYGARLAVPADAGSPITVLSPGTVGFRIAAGAALSPGIAARAGGALLTWRNPSLASVVNTVSAVNLYPFGP